MCQYLSSFFLIKSCSNRTCFLIKDSDKLFMHTTRSSDHSIYAYHQVQWPPGIAVLCTTALKIAGKTNITVNFWLFLLNGIWGNDGWKLSRKLLPAYQLVTHLAHSNHFRQSNSLHDIGQNFASKNIWELDWNEWAVTDTRESCGVERYGVGEAPGINPPLSWKATAWSDNIHTDYSCCRILFQSSAKIAANGSNLEFHNRGVAISDAIFFPPSPNITPHCWQLFGNIVAIPKFLYFKKYQNRCAKSSYFVYSVTKWSGNFIRKLLSLKIT